MCGRFQETTYYALHATACLDQHLITISSPTVLQSLIVSAAVWPPLPRPPCLSLSLSLSVYCTHRQSVGKLPPEVPCWARSSVPQVAVVISRQRGLMRHAMGHTPDVLAWHQITASPQTFAHAIKPTCRVFWTTTIASCRYFADLLITCMHPRTFLRARK